MSENTGDAVYDEGGSIKIGNIDRVTPVSIAIAVASASVLASEWSEIASKRKKGGAKVLAIYRHIKATCARLHFRLQKRTGTSAGGSSKNSMH